MILPVGEPTRYPTDHICLAVTLSTDNEAMRFVRAREDLEADLPGTIVRIISFSDFQEGFAPPPGSEHPGGPWLLVGVIVGPRAEEIPDAGKPAADTDWTRQVMEILESYGLEEVKDMVT
jgi:hypothetical protein